MPQFVVPQFIDIETKIIGPITVRQFIMGVISALIVFISYKFSDFGLFVIETFFIVIFYILIAFLKINGRPTYYFVASVIISLRKPSIRTWGKKSIDGKSQVMTKDSETSQEQFKVAPRKKLRQQELSSLALLVDTGGRFRPEEILQRRKNQSI